MKNPDYPHICNRCGASAYDSGISVKCLGSDCPNFDKGVSTNQPSGAFEALRKALEAGYGDAAGSVLVIEDLGFLDLKEEP